MKAVVTAAIPGIGAFGAITAYVSIPFVLPIVLFIYLDLVSVWTYLPEDAPDYRKGNTANLAASSTICVLVTLTAFYIRWENAKRDRGERDYRLNGDLSPEQETQLGYRHPRFRYQI